MKRFNSTALSALLIAILLLCATLVSCTSSSDTEKVTDDTEQTTGNSNNSVNDPVTAGSTVRYGMMGHFPISLTENVYNSDGQLLSGTALDSFSLAPDYVNLRYVTNRQFVYENGQLIAVYANQKKIPVAYDENTHKASGSAQYSESELIKAEITFNDRNILIKEDYYQNGELSITFEYDKNGNIIKELRHSNDFAMNLAYAEESFTFFVRYVNLTSYPHICYQKSVPLSGRISDHFSIIYQISCNQIANSCTYMDERSEAV
ncbi:MAG: hypothetical protein IJX76_07525 [Clostridia bacterium]|nr:hypothetical protein [Clostridia bacterium]